MPIVLNQRMEKGHLVVWKITETTNVLLSMARLTEEEQERYSVFRAETRKVEWLAVRALVRQVLGDKVSICYNQIGAPGLSSGECCLSISHTEGYVAVLFSPTRCGVDIESRTRPFLRVKRKFVGHNEQNIVDNSSYDENTTCGIIWCVKEALFKMYGEINVDFINDIQLVRMTDCTIFAHFRENNSEVGYFVSEEYILVVAG